MPSSEEVLTRPPAPHRRPVLRAAATVVIAGLVAWSIVARLSADDQQQPAAAGPPATLTAQGMPLGPPPWVRYPTPLEGEWVSVRDSGRLTLVVKNFDLDMWLGTEQRPRGRLLAHRTILVIGDRVLVRVPGNADEAATYRWRVDGDRLTLRLVERTPKSADTLGGPAYHRA